MQSTRTRPVSILIGIFQLSISSFYYLTGLNCLVLKAEFAASSFKDNLKVMSQECFIVKSIKKNTKLLQYKLSETLVLSIRTCLARISSSISRCICNAPHWDALPPSDRWLALVLENEAKQLPYNIYRG